MYLLRMPRLGQTMESGTVVRWACAPGESFAEGQDLYDVSTEKVEVAVEAKTAGTLLRIVVEEGVEVDVGTALAVVAEPGEDVDPGEIDRLVAGESVPAAPVPPHVPTAAPVPAAAPVPPPVPTAAPVPAASPVVPTASPAPVTAGAAAGERPAAVSRRVIPRARRLAAERGIDLAGVRGTGRTGAVTVADVEAAAAPPALPAPPPGPQPSPEPTTDSLPPELRPAVLERHRLAGVHRAMAEGVARSWPEIPQFTQTVEVDCTALLARRAAEAPGWDAAYGVRPSVNHYVVQAVVAACRYVPDANARMEGDEIVTFADVNPTVAVAAPLGLLTPVLRRAHTMDLGTMARAMGDLVDRARRGALTPDDFAGGTITISNLGMFGVDTGTPLVNRGQAVIVFAGAVKERPVAVAGRLEVRHTMHLTISADHRVLDGLTGALFLTAVRDELEGRG